MTCADAWFSVKQAAAGVLGLLMAPSVAPAERNFIALYLVSPNRVQVRYDPREAVWS